MQDSEHVEIRVLLSWKIITPKIKCLPALIADLQKSEIADGFKPF